MTTWPTKQNYYNTVRKDRTSTITSLEELLNVTGINQTEEINFSEIAREVEAQHGGQGRKRSFSQEDTALFMNTTNGMISAKQPKMELNSSAQPHSGHTEFPASSVHQMRVPIEQSDSHRTFPVQTIAQHSQGSGARTSVPDRTPTAIPSMLKSSGICTGQANGTNAVTLQSGKGGCTSNSSTPLSSFATTANVSPPATNAITTAGASVPIAAGMSLKSLSQVNCGNLVLQLVQLYRQYQQLGDTQGMTKVKQQLSTFLSTQNNKAITSTSQPANVPLLAPVKSHVAATSTQLIGQPRSGVFLGTNPSMSSSSTSFPPSMCSSNFQPLAPKPMLASNLSHVGHKPSPIGKPSSQTMAPMPTLPVNVLATSVKTTPSISLPSTISGKGTDFSTVQFVQGRPDLITQLVPSLISSLSSSSNSTTVSSSSQSQDVLKTMYMYRVKQIQAFMQGLPADQKPRNLSELKDLLKRYNVNFQANDLVGSMSQLPSASSGLSSATNSTSLGSQGPPVNALQLPSPPISISQKGGISFPLLASSGQLSFSAKPTTAMATPQPFTTLAKPANLNTSGTPASVMTSLPNPRVAAAPIQPGMVTPLPPGLNLEALAKLCSLPESELVKHNLPPSLLTAIKVWKQQQKSEPQSSLFKSVEATSTDIPVLMGKEDKIFTSGIGIPVARLNLPMVAERSADPHHSSTAPSFSAAAVKMAPLDKSSVTKTFADSRDHFAKALASMQTSLDPSNLTSHPSSPSLSGYLSTNVQQQARGTFGLPTVSRADLDSITASLASRVTVGPLGDGNSPLLAHLSSLRTQRQGPSQLSGYQGAMAASAKQPADITKLPVSGMPTQSNSSPAAQSNGSRPMTRYQAKVEHARAEHERIQTIHKILQSSDEAKIAFRIQSHLEKMQSQVVTPDIHTPFKSFQDVLVRLLPYHILSEPEPAPGTMEKADAVVESVAQILMSRSRGLISRYQQLVLKDTQVEHDRPLCILLDRLFTEAEHERIAQENREKQQAEQIAADLSLIGGDNMISFDNDFSFGDILNDDPMFSLDPGVT